jgi:chaperonin cofactor prefoldin
LNLANSLVKLNVKISDLEAKNQSFKKSNVALKEAHTTLEAENELLGKSKVALEEENNNLKQSNTDHEKTTRSLRKEIDTATKTKSTYQDWLFKAHEKSSLLEGKVALLEKKLAIVEPTKSNNERTIVDSVTINNEAVEGMPAKSSSELPIVTFTRSDFLKQRVQQLSTTNSQQEKTIQILNSSNGNLRSQNQELQAKTKVMEEELDGLKAELSDANTRAEKAAKDASKVAMNFLLHKANVTDPALNKLCNERSIFKKATAQLNRQNDKLNAKVEALESQVERLRSTNSRLKSELALVHQHANISKLPVLTQAVVTCVYSSVPSPSDGDHSPVPTNSLSCQTETEEKKSPHHRGKRGGVKKKKTADQSSIVTSKDSDISNANVIPENSNTENEAAEEQTVPEPDATVTSKDSDISNANVIPENEAVEEQTVPEPDANVTSKDSDISIANVIPENEAVEEQTVPEPDANVTSKDSDISNANVILENSNTDNEAAEEQTVPDANVTVVDSNISKGNVNPAVSNIDGEDTKKQLAAPSRGENDNVTSDISNNEETASGPKKRRNRHKPVLMTLKAYKFVMSRVSSYAHYVYTPILFLFFSLFLTLSWSRTFNPVAPIDYEPGLFLVSPLPSNASQIYDIYSPPSSRTPMPTPTCSPPPTSTSLTSERHQSRCAHI